MLPFTPDRFLQPVRCNLASGGDLHPGMYLYSLIADGRLVDTKRMVLTE